VRWLWGAVSLPRSYGLLFGTSKAGRDEEHTPTIRYITPRPLNPICPAGPPLQTHAPTTPGGTATTGPRPYDPRPRAGHATLLTSPTQSPTGTPDPLTRP
jgi:hypothetical protein